MTYVVLGMHKSGTTLVARMLHGSGIPMVEMVSSVDYHAGNKWERASTLAFDEDILAARDVDSLLLPPPDAAELLREEHFERAHQLVTRIEAETAAAAPAGSEWGFKDPRACLTWPVWRRVLAAPRIVGVYRQPGAVVRHYLENAPRYRTRPLWRLRLEWLALRRWCEHNECILAAIDGAPGASILLSYERLMRGDGELAHLRRFIGRDLTDSRMPGQHAGTGRDGARARLGARLAQLAGAGAVSATLARLEAKRVQLLAALAAAKAVQ